MDELKIFDTILEGDVLDEVQAAYLEGSDAITEDMAEHIISRLPVTPVNRNEFTGIIRDALSRHMRDMDIHRFEALVNSISYHMWELGEDPMGNARTLYDVTYDQYADAVNDVMRGHFREDTLDYMKAHLYALRVIPLPVEFSSLYEHIAQELDDREFISDLARRVWRLGQEPAVHGAAAVAAAAPAANDGWQPFEYQAPDLEERKREQLAKQDGERANYLQEAEPEVRNAYYVSALGPKYRDIEFFDSIMQEDTTIGEYIDDDLDNILFIVKDAAGKNAPFATLRSQVQKQLAVYDCDDDGQKYINMTNLGAFGMAGYDAVKTVVVRSNYQIFLLQHSGKKTGRLITHEIRHFEDGVVGGFHCQEGTQTDYYEIHVPPSAKIIA